MTRELWLLYAANKVKIKQLEEQNDLVKDQLLQEVKAEKQAEPLTLSEFPGYTFDYYTKTTYHYSEFVEQSQKAIDERKKEEKQKGWYQSKEEVEILVFKEIKKS